MTRRSAPHEARTVSLLGLHPIWNTSSAWLSNTCSRWLRLRQSCSATCGGVRLTKGIHVDVLDNVHGVPCEQRVVMRGRSSHDAELLQRL